MPTKKLIGLVGAAGSGKSTSAGILQRHGYARLPFAYPLKKMLQAGFGLSDEEVNGALKNEPSSMLLGKTPRYVLQRAGTEFGREMIHPNIWVHAWEQSARRYGRQCSIVADDVRFLNEIGTIHKLGGVVIEIRRPGATAGDFADHKSEHEWRDGPIDHVIVNDGTLRELEHKVIELLGLENAIQTREPLGAK